MILVAFDHVTKLETVVSSWIPNQEENGICMFWFARPDRESSGDLVAVLVYSCCSLARLDLKFLILVHTKANLYIIVYSNRCCYGIAVKVGSTVHNID